MSRTLGAHATQGKGCAITTVGWVVAGLAAWVAAAVVVGLVVGRIIRQRDRQVPRSPESVAGEPVHRDGRDRRDVDEAGRGRPGRS